MAFFETTRLNSMFSVAIRISEIASFSQNPDNSCMILMKGGKWYLVSASWDEVNRAVKGSGTTTEDQAGAADNLDDIPF